MRIATLVKKVAAARKEKEGIKRLLAAVAAETAQPIRVYGGHVDTTPELPVCHPYSEVWNFVELDPNKWH